MKIGSLFDGSGGFPLAASLCGIEPVWAAEIEPYPIAVTRSRFPNMKHLGSVTDIKGDEVEPVDVITFGSPCQDLSVAGKRAGLKHTENGDEETTRSGLFMEAVRIIKEMRNATNGKYPRYAVWENVPGAFSSNKGLDFRIVLEELIRIAEPTAVMPKVPKGGWAYSDVYCGDGWSLAYRVLDAQYWGVPQRRRRIYLVADFGGQRAGKVSFEREGLRGYSAQSGSEREGVAGDVASSIGAANREGEGFDGYNGDLTGNGSSTRGGNCGMSTGRNGVIERGLDAVTLEPGIAAREGGHIYESVSGTLRANAGDNQMAVAYGIDHAITTGGNCTAQGSCVYENIEATLKASGAHAVAYGVTTKGNGDAFISEERHTSLSTGGGQPGQGYPCAMQPISYTLKIRSGCEGGGKGALIQTGMSATLATNNDQYLFQPICMATQQGGAEIRTDDKAPTVTAAAGMSGNNQPVVCYPETILDDQGGSQISVRTDGKCPTLRAEMHGNVPCVMDAPNVVCCIDGDKIGKAERAGGSGLGIRDGDKMYTLTAKDAGTHSVCIPIHDQATRFSGKRGDKADGKGNGLGVGNPDDPMNTLTSGDRHAVAYGIETFHCTSEEEKAPTLKARDWKDPHVVAYWDGGQTAGTLTANNAGGNQRMPDKDNFNCVISIDRAAFNQGQNALYSPQFLTDGTTSTLVAQGPSAVAQKNEIQYIVRRLTPTECARLQGFPDNWGHIDEKSDFTDEEYAFWLNVRNTHAAINDKVVKDYTKDQMLTWYNKLHTDSSEYKLWGNGIALPCALYVMEGIAEGLHES